MNLIEAMKTGKPFRLKGKTDETNPWLKVPDWDYTWISYAECETAMKERHIVEMLFSENGLLSDNWEVKKA